MSARATRAEAGVFNGYRSAAVLSGLLSWVTTWWFLEWVFHPAGSDQWWIVFGSSIALEWVLIQAKKLLYSKRGGKGVGWTAIIVDAFLLNAGGIFDKAGRVLVFPPVAAVLSFAKIDVYDAATNRIGALIVAFALGYFLSIAPIRLWRAGS